MACDLGVVLLHVELGGAISGDRSGRAVVKSGPTCSHFPGTGVSEGCPAAARVWGAARPGSDCACAFDDWPGEDRAWGKEPVN